MSLRLTAALLLLAAVSSQPLQAHASREGSPAQRLCIALGRLVEAECGDAAERLAPLQLGRLSPLLSLNLESAVSGALLVEELALRRHQHQPTALLSLRPAPSPRSVSATRGP